MDIKYGVLPTFDDLKPKGGEYGSTAVIETKVVHKYDKDLNWRSQHVFSRIQTGYPENRKYWALLNPMRGQPEEIFYDPETNFAVRKHFYEGDGIDKIQKFDRHNGNLIFEEHCCPEGPDGSAREDGAARIWYDRETGEITRKEVWYGGEQVLPDDPQEGNDWEP